jgi:thiamine-phosphate pyrophosphorylase
VTRASIGDLEGIYPLADDDARWKHDPRALVEAALAGGARVIQLRLKRTPDRDALALARWAAARTRAAGALLFVNDRFDLADLAGADGVHLGEEDVPPERIPADVRGRLLVALSTHALEGVRASRGRPVDCIAFGPVFGTVSKRSPYDARGVDALREAVSLAAHPLIAIGGITGANVADVAAAGAAAAAVISAIADAPDPAAETRRLQRLFRSGREAAAL